MSDARIQQLESANLDMRLKLRESNEYRDGLAAKIIELESQPSRTLRNVVVQVATTATDATVTISLVGGDRPGFSFIDGQDALDAALEYLTALRKDMRLGVKKFAAPNAECSSSDTGANK